MRNTRLNLFVWIPTVMLACLALTEPAAAQFRKPTLRPGERAETYLVTVVPEGMYPKRIERQEGPFVIRIEDRSGMRETSVVFRRKGQVTPELEGRHTRQKADIDYVIDPEPGEYTVALKENPKITLELVIKPR